MMKIGIFDVDSKIPNLAEFIKRYRGLSAGLKTGQYTNKKGKNNEQSNIWRLEGML